MQDYYMPDKISVFMIYYSIIQYIYYNIYILNMKNEETQWKKERFSKETQNNSENFETNTNPDVTYIKQKIQKINKRKKYKKMFTQMEPLTNIYETSPSEFFEKNAEKKEKSSQESSQSFWSRLSSKFECKSCGEDSESESESDEKSNRKKIGGISEGFDVDAATKNELNKQKSERMGGVNLEFKKFTEPVKSAVNQVNDILFYVPKKLNETVENIFLKFVKVFYALDKKNDESNIKSMENDAEILKIVCYMIAMYPIAIYICYNWTFLTIYKGMEYKTDPASEEPERPVSDNKRLKISFNGFSSTMRKILNFCLDFGIMPTHIFDMAFLSDKSWAVPNMASFIGSKILSRAIILIFSITVIYMFDVYQIFGNVMATGALWATISGVTVYCATVISIYYFYWIIKDIENIVSPANLLSDPDSYIHTLLKWIANPLVMLFFKIIHYIVRLAISIINIGISAVILTLFIWGHSLFGMAWYGGNGFSYKGIKQTMKDIDAFIDKDFEVIMPLNPQFKEYSILEKIFIDIVKFFKDNIYSFFFVIMIVGSLANIALHIKSPTLKIVMSTIFSLLGVAMLVYKFLTRKTTTETGENPSVNKYNEDTYMTESSPST